MITEFDSNLMDLYSFFALDCRLSSLPIEPRHQIMEVAVPFDFL